MIEKFQTGGKQQQDAVMKFVQGLANILKADPKQVIQIAQQNPDALKSAVEVYQQTQDMNQAAQAFAQSLKKKTKAAKHGARLEYIRSLKNQCADNEELVYYRKGGSVGCGCKKKEDGGRVLKENKESVVEKFKAKCGSKLKK